MSGPQNTNTVPEVRLPSAIFEAITGYGAAREAGDTEGAQKARAVLVECIERAVGRQVKSRELALQIRYKVRAAREHLATARRQQTSGFHVAVDAAIGLAEIKLDSVLDHCADAIGGAL